MGRMTRKDALYSNGLVVRSLMPREARAPRMVRPSGKPEVTSYSY
ncbi:MAG TPA: hypothetical protein PK566_18325 [Pseudobacteroides sp.]|nr:hypothetical protein [Pseudobacteroides sp.]